MTTETESPEKAESHLASAIEKMVDTQYLVLFLSFSFYLDIWLLRNDIDLTSIPVSGITEGLKSISIFTAATFLVSYSLLMSVFFPTVRVLVGALLMHVFNMDYHLNRTQKTKRFSDWSMSLVAFSVWSGVTGVFSNHSKYKGLVVYVWELSQMHTFSGGLFVLCSVALWSTCLCLATQADL